MDQKLLKQINFMRKELKYYEDKLNKIRNLKQDIVIDSVQASSRTFPYTSHTAVIEGIASNKGLKKYKRMVETYQEKLEKLLINLTYEINHIKDSEIRLLIQYRYIDNYSFAKIQVLMEYASEDIGRKKLERFLKNF